VSKGKRTLSHRSEQLTWVVTDKQTNVKLISTFNPHPHKHIRPRVLAALFVPDLCGYFLPLVNVTATSATSETIFSLSVFKIIRALRGIVKLLFCRGTAEKEGEREK